ncbi:hypothetical protein J2Z22_004856 [Paenibacillus forsythiae]|uniref:Knr4/Smi1-like domain-containing protein n=1 Tax=Paenibacillus forsythiae TaxID=365616 RepID=A0ABU3HHU1_9BACL|nr:SMI1/KNR4 family protein [Paenibacillus forsythiae]MDT3429255.1 hypothetical protein [Paenibacillus forsythiae]
MARQFFSENENLQPFFNEINLYVDGVHDLNQGIDFDTIESLERELKVQFPKIYKDFLHVCNGGELFVQEQFYQKYISPLPGKEKGGAHI